MDAAKLFWLLAEIAGTCACLWGAWLCRPKGRDEWLMCLRAFIPGLAVGAALYLLADWPWWWAAAAAAAVPWLVLFVIEPAAIAAVEKVRARGR